jgi:hypothetical protein
MRHDPVRGRSRAWQEPEDWQIGTYTGTFACTPELFGNNVEVTVVRRKPISGVEREAEGEQAGGAWRRDIDTRLATLYQAALDEPLPGDILRLVEQIGARQSRN